MNASLSDGNEPAIDIFILSQNPDLSAQLEKQFRDEGYYVTLFSEGAHLLETLRNGKPNLLMCDTTQAETDAFEVCRQIKADDYLWNIPVLVITGASDLGDLLRVLDCNADNFIAYPFDPPYLISLIEGMLTTPVERQTPEQIKTQFKIKHDEQVFVVTADRRKLLEFLLSSFEIAVNKSSDLSRAQEDVRSLTLTTRKLDETVEENTKVIGIINETLRTREQKIAELTGELASRDQALREQAGTIDQLTRDLSAEKASCTEAQDEIRRIAQEKDEAVAVHQVTIGQLQRQVNDLSSETALLRPALDQANAGLARESGGRRQAEEDLAAVSAQKEQAEKALGTLTAEFEQLKISYGTEKSRAEEAGQELTAVLQAKAQSEQDLTGIINDLKATATEQAAALTRLREESAAAITKLQEELDSERVRFARETEEAASRHRGELEGERTRFAREQEDAMARIRQGEENLAALAAAKEQSETALQETIDARQKHLLDLQAWLETAKAQMEDRDATIRSLNGQLAEAQSVRETIEADLASVSRNLAEANTALGGREQEIAGLNDRLGAAASRLDEMDREIAGLNDQLAAVTSARESAETELASVSRTLAETATALETGTRDIASHKEDLARLREEKERADALAESLNASIRELQGELDREKGRYRENEERMNALVQERTRALAELRKEHEDARTSLSSRDMAFEQVKRELGAANAARAELEESLKCAEEKNRQLGQELGSASADHAGEKQKLAALEGDLEAVKKRLEQETLRRQESEDQLREALSQQQQLEGDLERYMAETKTLHADLVAERGLHETAKKQNRSLEEQVSALNHEKSIAEEAAASLTAEIDQARVALADEWEDHMTDHERLEAAVAEKRAPPAQSVTPPGVRREAEILKKRSLIVKAPTIPRGIPALPRTMVPVDPERPHEPETSPIRSVEDLFEDDEERPGKIPSVSIVQDPATGPVRDVLPDALDTIHGEPGSFFEEETPGSPGEPDDDEEAEGPIPDSENLAFNRAQWLDLLKWSHHCDALEPEQRMQIVRMGRLIQKGRKLTRRQEEQVMEMIALVRSLGYRMH